MLNEALSYAARGWSVIPLHFTGDTDNRKRPLVEWDQFKKERATAAMIREWWGKWPNANIGIVMGEVSGLIAIDVDGPHGVELLRRAKVSVPQTACVATGNGYHAYYKHPGYPVPNRARLLEGPEKSGVDVRGDGGYVVAPPSVHGSGRVYSWAISPEQGIAELPADLAALVTRRALPESPSEDGWVDSAMRGVLEGQRDNVCARLAGYWLRMVEPDDCMRVLRGFAAGCTPPFSERDLRKTVESVARIERARQDAELSSQFAKLGIVESEQWLRDIERDEGRKGIAVNVPGFVSVGGLVPEDLITLAGRPGMGKSTLACQLSVEAGIVKKVPTLIVSTEMTRRQWGAWMAAYLTESTTEILSRPLRDKARAEWLSSPISIADPGIVSIKEIRNMAESRIGLKLLIVDHIGRVGGGRKDSRVLEVGDVARGLKSLAKDLGCTVVSLCQMNRRIEGSEDKQPRLDDLRESGELEQESDSVLFLWTEDRDKTKAFLPMTVSLAKNRHGPTCTSSVTFDKARRRFLFEKEAPF
jgi:hypothetical protein